MAYSIRDLLGHFAKRNQEGKPCPHKCCRGKRVHPRQTAVIVDRDVLRAMSETQLVAHLENVNDDKAAAQIMRELDRRERADQSTERRKSTAAASREEHHLAVHAAYLDAERETRGHMLNAKGRAAGVDPRTLWTGTERRAYAYASEELRNYWDHHGRLTGAEWRKQQASQRAAVEYEDERVRRRADRRLYGVY
jgi:hypothetical protein